MNKQPFYCTATILFTATNEITEEQMHHALNGIKRLHGVIDKTVEVESFTCDPGDPADLM